MLELANVTRRFGANTAVDSVTLSIPQGQMVGVIGRSGAGKSTLLRMINRLIGVSDGVIRFEGTEVSALRGTALRNWQRDCAMIFQQFNLVPRLDVLTNVLLGRLNHRSTLLNLLNIFSDEERAQALMALERLGIAQTALQRAGTLSGGQQQRVAIARALLQSPKMILADEPIASLDPLNAQVVMDSLADINRREGMTVITNLHTLDTARAYCERVIGMSAGKVVFDGPARDLTPEAVKMIYGVSEGELSEEVTSTALGTPKAARAASQSTGHPAGVTRQHEVAGIASPA
ncbi:MAG: phosphonate ABC transporter ATP-binding protein [Zhengella sp.]|uniref:phosphonate ABC transporter ATP-binding protein n=1 Tax=Zhengella sp. TaxID=2282762 RepID=UPI001DFACC4B|nr:phosphonate ABC transporter ATP-binding protein [Notoacmeibacter sp.]MCC0025830.1 phosphonate ABC transporter ATP-binding protein [Brucellaceae bacterium]